MKALTAIPDGVIVRRLLDCGESAFDILKTVNGISFYSDEVFSSAAAAREATDNITATGWNPYTHTAEAAELWEVVE